jgi:ABC-2 type transport system permease protein
VDDRVKIEIGTFAEGKQRVEDSDALFAVLLIPKDFSQNLMKKQMSQNVSVTLTIYMDSTKPAIRASIMGAINDALQDLIGDAAIKLDQQIAYTGKEYSGLDVSVPSVMGLVLTFLVLLVALLTAIREKLGGTQFRLLTTPISGQERVLGYVIALSFFALAEAVLVLIFGVFIFGATVEGNIFVLIFAAFLYGMVNVFIAMLLSNFAENELQAVQMAPMISFPSMALSGMLVPIASMPEVAQIVARFIPMTYAIEIFEGIMLKGYGLNELFSPILALVGFALGSLVITVVTTKNHLTD